MPFDLPLPKGLRKLWKIKIQDKELLFEEPHGTIWRRNRKWRFGLRSRRFLDPRPDPGEVPDGILALIDQNHQELSRQWDARFPTNPVAGQANGDDE